MSPSPVDARRGAAGLVLGRDSYVRTQVRAGAEGGYAYEPP